MEKRVRKDPISKLGMRDPIIVDGATSVKKVIAQMKSKHRGCVLIVEKDKLLGIFTERDALQKIGKPQLELTDIEIQNVMTPAPEVLSDSDTIAFALNKMAMGNYRHVPVQQSDSSYTVLSVRDILRYFF